MALKIGVLGAGHLGKIHIKCIQLASEQLDLVGFFDTDAANSDTVVAELGAKKFDTAEALIEAVDIVDIVTPTLTHFQLAQIAIKKNKHVFIEKPLTSTVEEGRELIKIAKKHGVKVQVGHVERFNPAMLAIDGLEVSPMFIEGHRLAMFNPRGTDVSVVLDLMIHDLDIVLSMIKSPIREVRANGVSIVSKTPDIANTRIEFENGAVANLTASRISLKNMRKLRFFQPDAYVSLDFLEKNAQIVRLHDEVNTTDKANGNVLELQTPSGKKHIEISMPTIEPVNAIKMELITFAEAILNDTAPKVSIEDGLRALEVAEIIKGKISNQKQQIQ